MNIELSLTLFSTWLNGIFAASPAEAHAAEVTRQPAIQYAGPAHPGLIMDVYTPPRERAKGKGVIVVVSGGYFSTPRMLGDMAPFMRGLASASGYTIFATLHGNQGTSTIGEMIPQVQRAVRFVRHSAGRFGIDPAHLGIMGFSSGGFMALSAGVRGDDGQASSSDPVGRTASRVQAVVAFFPPTDFLNYGAANRIEMGDDQLPGFARAFIGHHTSLSREQRHALARSLSPRTHASAHSAPTLLIHGSADRLVPLQQSEVFREAMHQAHAVCELRVRDGAGHGWPNMQPDLAAAGNWFDHYLKAKPSREQKQRVRVFSSLD